MNSEGRFSDFFVGCNIEILIRAMVFNLIKKNCICVCVGFNLIWYFLYIRAELVFKLLWINFPWDIWRVYLDVINVIIMGSSLRVDCHPLSCQHVNGLMFSSFFPPGCGPGDRRRPEPQQEEERWPRWRGWDLHEEPRPAEQPEPGPRSRAGAGRHPGAQEAHQNFRPREVGDQTGGFIQYLCLHTLIVAACLSLWGKHLIPFLEAYFITCLYSCPPSAPRWLLPTSCPKKNSPILTTRLGSFLKLMMKRVRNSFPPIREPLL